MWKKSRATHPGRLENMPAHIVPVANTGDFFDHQAEQYKAAIAVAAALPRREVGWFVDEQG